MPTNKKTSEPIKRGTQTYEEFTESSAYPKGEGHEPMVVHHPSTSRKALPYKVTTGETGLTLECHRIKKIK